MAIEENDRENLLRDAKMMPVRGETQIDGHTIVIGFRSDSQASLYCDADPVFQFNANNQLRRVYFHGERYAAEQGVLIKLTRESQGGKVVFHREPASKNEANQIQSALANWLNKIERTAPSSWTSANDDAIFTKQLKQWIHCQPSTMEIAGTPNVCE